MNKAMCESKKSHCLKHRVGAVLVKNGEVVCSAFNKVVDGMDECEVVGCRRVKLHLSNGERAEECRGMHAEQVLLIRCLVEGIDINEGVIYCTHSPCAICARLIAAARVKRVVFASVRKERQYEQIFKDAGVEYRQIEFEEVNNA